MSRIQDELGFTEEQAKAYDKYQKFIQFRNKFSVILSIIVLACYYAFIIGVGWFPEVLGYPIGPSVVTLGILAGLTIIVTSIIITGIYTFVANTYFDRDQAQIVEELQKSGVADKITKGTS
ncbi:hypothetical protein CCZ01_01450 [Helicobacter monodelphidis]|uniref:DUF485 domain-containing protein n=1 Tax=Helicobacter sp. 15-1451 TaxID=2004995 RepID=UPI000DCE956D|nr:DUF485 domain-containing protein [Helicobacter sp. 15-1451]RAX58888.1 hypothetical protein CCZ01_01450 [Helicobacter sp. 15-1451]